jgi:hypothetical protein
MGYTEWSEWIENLLATLDTLRVFGTEFKYGGQYDPKGHDRTRGYLRFIKKVSNRAPKLEYFSISNGKGHYEKLAHGGWVLSDEARFPSALAFGM